MSQTSTLVPTSQIVLVPLSLIRPNPDNPRGPVFPSDAQAMAGSLKEIGQQTPIKIRPLTDQEKAQFPPFEFLILGGHVRFEGAKLAGLETLQAIVLEPRDPAEEELDALLDNRWSEMSWWRWDLAIVKRLLADSNLSQRKLAAQLGFSQKKISNAMTLMKSLNAESRTLVEENLQKNLISADTPGITQNKGFLITESHLLALADLEDPSLVEKAIREVLDDYLTESQTRKLVGQMKSPQVKAEKAAPTSQTVPTLREPQGPEQNRAGDGIAQDDSQKAKAATPAQGMGTTPNLALEAMAGMPLMAGIEAKLKKGEKLTPAETLVLTLNSLTKAGLWVWKKVLHPVLKFFWGLAKKAFHLAGRLLKDSLKSLTRLVGQPIRWFLEKVVTVVFLVGLIWLVWDMSNHGVWHPIELLKGKLGFTRQKSTVQEKPKEMVAQPAPQPPAQPVQQAPPVLAQSVAVAPQPASKLDGQPQDAKPSVDKVQAQSPAQAEQKPVQAPVPVAKKDQGDALGQVGDMAGKAARGVDVAKKLFGF